MKLRDIKTNFKKLLPFTGFIIIILCLFLLSLQGVLNQFDEKEFDVDRAYDHIKELASPKYNGRLAGTEGNIMALQYVEEVFKEIGIEPGGEDGTYYQSFNSMVPMYTAQPFFKIIDSQGNVVKEFKIREDYRDFFYCSGRVSGNLILLTKRIINYEPWQLKDKIIVTDFPIIDEDLSYAKDSGAKAFVNTYYSQQWGILPIRLIKASGNLNNLQGKEIVNLLFEVSSYKELSKYASEGYRVEIGQEFTYQLLETPNVLGKIEGKDKNAGYLIISAHIDHVGSEYNREKYFPGALDDASGIGVMLELAKTMKAQKSPPDKTIIFAGWNTEEGGLKGSYYYTRHPIYPLDKTQLIQLDCIGSAEFKNLWLGSANEGGNMLRSLLFQHAEIQGVRAEECEEASSDHRPFAEAGVPAVLVMDDLYDKGHNGNGHYIHMYQDDINNISKDHLQKVSSILLSYFKREIFKDFRPDYLNFYERLLLLFVFAGLLFIYMIYLLNKVNSNMKIGRITVEEIYYSFTYNLFLKVLSYSSLIFIGLFIMIAIANVPENFNMRIEHGMIHTNFSLNVILQKSIVYLRSLLSNGLGTTIRQTQIADVIVDATGRSIKLMGSALLLAFVLGIGKGILDGYRDKSKAGLGTVGTIMALSIPDVMLVLLLQLLIIYTYKHNILPGIMENELTRKFIIPVVCLSIVPTVYISRIITVSIQEDMGKYYVKVAAAKGLPKYRILISHLLPSSIIKAVDSLSSVITIAISNLIIIEYLYNYPGVIFMLLKSYREGDTTAFIGLSISLGFLYILFNIGLMVISYIINPLKREGVY